MTVTLSVAVAALAAASFALATRSSHVDSFFKGWSGDGRQPGVLTLTFSQVTTWIFARSLMTAALLGYAFGIAGGLAYAAYYLSFFTGAAIVDQVRFRYGHDSLQSFLRSRFGAGGETCFNIVVAVRLLSEVFANLLVIGLLFGPAGSLAYGAVIVGLAGATLAYSMLGGMRASLRTDVLQMSVFAVLLVLIAAALAGNEAFSLADSFASSPLVFENGWTLLVVALLQVVSYPMHDPVMMDRGFIADRRTTLRSFLHAGWISILCILAFSLLGVFAGLNRLPGEEMMSALARLLGEPTMTLITLALIVSAVSTLDSTLSSAAKLAVVDMRLARVGVANGRIAMALFMAGGLVFLFIGSRNLFDAVAVSGTASMFLAPVIVIVIWGGVRVAAASFYVAFASSIAGAALYFVEAGGAVSLFGPLLGIEDKYDKLLLICLAVLGVDFAAFAAGAVRAPAAGSGTERAR